MSATGDELPFVFVSYASVNRERVVEIVEALEEIGVATWFDRSDIPGGTSYGPEIVAGIKNATALLLMCSEDALASRNVRQEIQLAWRHERPILPLLLEPLIFPDDVSYWLEGAQWIEVLDQPTSIWLDPTRRALALMGYQGLRQSGEGVQSPTIADIEMPPNNLPVADSPMVGRDRELRHVASLLSHGRVITLTGTGGSGKTRLAEEIARSNAARYSDGIWFVDAAACRTGDDLVSEIAETLAIQESPSESLIHSIGSGLSNKQSLLLLDNLEQVNGAAEVVSQIVAFPGPTVLITSRAPTRADFEIVTPVSPLEMPVFDIETPASTIGRNPAVQIFVDRARRVKPDFQLSDGNAREVAEICARLDGLPLAIELAASRSRLLHPAAILNRLDSRLNLLSRGSARSARQQTLHATIAWSYELLDPASQAVFRRFAVFVRGATLETVELVVTGAGDDVPPEAVLDSIDELIDHGLLEVDRSHSDPDSTRVRMLETIREFALVSLSSAGDSNAIQDVHADTFRRLTDTWIGDLESGNQSIALSLISSDYGNILAAVEHLRRSRDPVLQDQGVEFASSLWRYWWMKGAFSEGRKIVDSALADYGDRPSPARAAALNASGILAFSLGHIDEARQFHSDAAALSEKLELDEELARSRDSLGIVEIVSGDVELSIEHFNAALKSYRDAGNQRGVATALSNLVASNTAAGNFAIAESLAHESLETWRSTGDQQAISQTLLQIGVAELFSRRYDEAKDHFEQALVIAESLDDRSNTANALANLGSATEMLGDLEEAGRLIARSQAIYRELEDVSRMAYLDYMHGHLARLSGNSVEAWDLLLRAAEALSSVGQPDAVALCLESLAGLSIDGGHAEHAARCFGGAMRIRDETGMPLPENRTDEYNADRAATLAALGQTDFDGKVEEGRNCDPLQLIELLKSHRPPAIS